jgi:predicted dienelactone hydrolase
MRRVEHGGASTPGSRPLQTALLRAVPPGRKIASFSRRAAAAVCTAAAALAWPAAAQDAAPGVGLARIASADPDDGPITLFYPSRAAARDVQRGPYTLHVAEDGAPARGNGRLVVFSHGTGAVPWVQADLARALVAQGFVVAMPRHRGDHLDDRSLIGPPSWRLRPHEVSRAIDAVLADARFAPLVDGRRVGVFGFSAGGHTALTLAGGRWSAARQLAHCERHLADDWAACTGGLVALDGSWLDGLKQRIAAVVLRWKLGGDEREHGHTDARIGAVVAAAPWAANFDPATFAAPAAPLALIEAPADLWLRPQWHGGAVLAACARCETIAAPAGAGHGALLSPLPPPDIPAWLRRLLDDPPGFDRAALPAMYERIGAFFRRHLDAVDAALPRIPADPGA